MGVDVDVDVDVGLGLGECISMSRFVPETVRVKARRRGRLGVKVWVEVCVWVCVIVECRLGGGRQTRCPRPG